MADQQTIKLNGALDRQTLSQEWWSSLSNSEQQRLRAAKNCKLDFQDVQRVDSAGLAWTLNAIRE